MTKKQTNVEYMRSLLESINPKVQEEEKETLQYIKNPSKEIQLAAVKRDGHEIK